MRRRYKVDHENRAGESASNSKALDYSGDDQGVLLGAVAVTMRPIKNKTIEARRTHLAEKYVYSLPHTGKAVPARRKQALAYHPISLSLWQSFVMSGIAVTTMPWEANLLASDGSKSLWK